MSKEQILVTGSAGFIGFHVAKELLDTGYSVIGVDNINDYYHTDLKEERSKILQQYEAYSEHRFDLQDIDALQSLFEQHSISRVCHLAAQAGVRYSIDHPFVYEQANLAAFLNILEMVRHHDVARLVYASSSSVYGGNKKVPFSETDPVDNPISLYAATKKANELMAHCYSHLYGMQTVGLRFFTVYGPWGRPDMAMWLFAEAIKGGKKIKVFNHGDMKRDFTFVLDIVQGVVSSLFADGLDQYEIFNLGNNQTEDLMRMIGLIEQHMGAVTEKEMLPMQPGDVPETYADIDKARQKLGYEPKTTIDQGIPEFINWYNQYSELTDKIRLAKG